MVTGALALGCRASWFAGDEVYCGRELRRGVRALGLGYTVGTAATYQVTDGAGRRWEARKLINKVRPEQWIRRRTGHGAKRTGKYGWAWIDVRPDDTHKDAPGAGAGAGTSVLVARHTGEVSFFRCFAPGDVSPGTLAEVICRRWRIEETFQLAKGCSGLDQGQVTCWNSWMRWPLFSLIAAGVPRAHRVRRPRGLQRTARARAADLPRTPPAPATTPPTRPAMIGTTAVVTDSRTGATKTARRYGHATRTPARAPIRFRAVGLCRRYSITMTTRVVNSPVVPSLALGGIAPGPDAESGRRLTPLVVVEPCPHGQLVAIRTQLCTP